MFLLLLIYLAVFTPGWAGDGYLEFSYGRRFRWVNSDFWGQKWAFLDAEGRHIVDFVPSGGFKSLFKYESSAELSAGAKDTSEAGLLIALGWYLMILMADDMAATMVAVSVF